MKQAFARFHQVKNASEISLIIEIIKNFQGCVYCLILNYHGSFALLFETAWLLYQAHFILSTTF